MDKRPVAKHAQETHSEGALWTKPWRKAKKGTKTHRAQHSHVSSDQQGLCNEDESWLEYRTYLFSQMPSLSSAAKAAFSIGTAIISVPTAEILDPPKPATSSSVNLPSSQLKKSETRLKTLEEEAVSAALAAAAATAAAAAERARISAQAALAMQAEQELEAAKADEEARLARESVQEDKASKQCGLACSLLSKRRRPTKTRTQRSGSVQQQSYSSELFSKRDPNAPIHSRPPPPMVSPRFAARLVELISTAAPVSVPPHPPSKPVQPKRTSVNRPSLKGVQQTSSPATGSACGSQSSANRSQTPSAARSCRPQQQTGGRQPSSSPPVPVHHPGIPTSTPSLPTNSNVQQGGQPTPSRSHPSIPSTCNNATPAHPPPQTTVHQAQPAYQPPPALQTTQVHQPPVHQPTSNQRQPPTAQLPQVQQSKTPVPPYSPPPSNKSMFPPSYLAQPPRPANQSVSPQPPKACVQCPYSPPPSKPPIQPPFTPPPSNVVPHYQPPPPYSFGSPVHTHQESLAYQPPLTQPQLPTHPAQPSYVSNQSYQPASHMYGTLPRKTQPNTTLNPTTPEFTPQQTTMAHVTIAMLPNTASTPNQWSQQPTEPVASTKPQNSNHRSSSTTRTSVGALLRSGIRSLGKTSVSVAALDRSKIETSVAWNTAKIAAPADESDSKCPERILPPSDLSENDSAVWFHQSPSQPTIPWSTAWQTPPALPVYNEGRTEHKPEGNSWHHEAYNFSLDMGTTVPQTIYEVDQCGSLNSLPQAYMPMDTMAPHRTDWWPKDPTEQRTCSWDKSISLAPPPAQQPQSPSSPSQQPNSVPPTYLPPPRSPSWQNQPPGDENVKKRTDGEPSQLESNSAKMSFQESMYQQTMFQCDYQQLPSQQQHYPETVLEEASNEEPQ